MFKFKLAEAFVEMTAHDGGLGRTLSQVDTRLGSLGRRLTSFAAITASIAGISAPFIGAAKWATDYEEALTRLRNKLGNQDLTRHEEAIARIARAYGVNKAEIVDLAAEMTAASGHIQNSLKTISVGAQLAASGMAPLREATSAVDSILSNFNLTSEEAEKVADKLLATNRRGQGSFAAMVQIISALAPVAASAKVGLDEFLASVATLSRTRDTERIGQLAGAMRYVALMTQEEGDSARGTAREVLANIMAHEGWFAVLRRLKKEGDDVQKTLLSGRGYEATSALVRDLTEAERDLTAISGASGLTREVVANGMQRFSYQIGRTWTATKALGEVLGAKVLPVLSGFTKIVADNIGRLTDWVSTNQELISSVLRAGIALAAFATAWTVLKVSLTAGALALGLVTSPLTLIGSLAGAAVLAIVALGSESKTTGDSLEKSAKKGQSAWKAFLDQVLPVFGTFTISIGTLPEALDLFLAKVNRFVLRIGDYAEYFTDYISAALDYAWDVVVGWLDRLSDRAYQFMQDLADVISAGFRAAFSLPWSEAEAEAEADLNKAWNKLTSARSRGAAGDQQARFRGPVLKNESSEAKRMRDDALKAYEDAYTRMQKRWTSLMNPQGPGHAPTAEEWIGRYLARGTLAVGNFLVQNGLMSPERQPREGATTPQQETAFSNMLRKTGETVAKAVSDLIAAPELWRKIQTSIVNKPTESAQEKAIGELTREAKKTSTATQQVAANTARMVTGVPAYPQ